MKFLQDAYSFSPENPGTWEAEWEYMILRIPFGHLPAKALTSATIIQWEFNIYSPNHHLLVCLV